jgi:hypothetical protein
VASKRGQTRNSFTLQKPRCAGFSLFVRLNKLPIFLLHFHARETPACFKIQVVTLKSHKTHTREVLPYDYVSELVSNILVWKHACYGSVICFGLIYRAYINKYLVYRTLDARLLVPMHHAITDVICCCYQNSKLKSDVGVA